MRKCYSFAPHLDDTENNGTEMSGEEQQSTSDQVPDPIDWSLVLGRGATWKAWSTEVKRHTTE